MDYREPLLLAVANTIAQSSPWDRVSNSDLSRAMYNRAVQGPISTEQAVLIAGTLMPTGFTFTFPSLAVTTAGSGPPADGLAPNPKQGIKSWYWNLTQFTNGDGKDSGVLIVLQQQSIVPGGGGITAWSLYVGAVDPVTKAWVSPNAVYLDNNQVQIVPNGVTFSNAEVTGSIIASAGGFSISLNMISGFQCAVSATSARGPTYEQSGGNVKKMGILQNGYWSIVDGVITTPSSTGFTSLQLTKTGTPYTYKGGYSWLDYQQFGLLPLSGFTKMLAATSKSRPGQSVWLFLVIQTDDVQMDAILIDPGALSVFSNGGTGRKWNVANVWQNGKPAQYGVACNVQLIQKYPSSEVPSAIKVTVDGFGVYVLTSFSKDIPYLKSASGSGYESPSYVTVNGAPNATARGVIEWVSADTYPSQQDALMGAAMNTDILKARNASSLAVATVTLSSIGIGAVLILLIFGIVYLVDKYPPRPKKTVK